MRQFKIIQWNALTSRDAVNSIFGSATVDGAMEIGVPTVVVLQYSGEGVVVFSVVIPRLTVNDDVTEGVSTEFEFASDGVPTGNLPTYITSGKGGVVLQ